MPVRWGAFLTAVDRALARRVELHCLGGFVLEVLYRRPVPTVDIDCIAVEPHAALSRLLELAGAGSPLARQHKVHFQFVTVADVPDQYESRLLELFPQRFTRLQLRALEVHDLILAKLTRNHPIDERDVQFLAEAGVLDPATLAERYRRELRPDLANQERHDLTLKLWLEDYFSR
ncbi:MAG: DUF6036 family nucleotidyltransferase [Terriglobia bacterium]